MTFIKFSLFIVFFVKRSKPNIMIVYIRVLAYKLVSVCMLLGLGTIYNFIIHFYIFLTEKKKKESLMKKTTCQYMQKEKRYQERNY